MPSDVSFSNQAGHIRDRRELTSVNDDVAVGVESEPNAPPVSHLIVCVMVDVSPQVTQTFSPLSLLLQHDHGLLGIPPWDGDRLIWSSPSSLKSTHNKNTARWNLNPSWLPHLYFWNLPFCCYWLEHLVILSDWHFPFMNYYLFLYEFHTLCICIQCLKWPVCLCLHWVWKETSYSSLCNCCCYCK